MRLLRVLGFAHLFYAFIFVEQNNLKLLIPDNSNISNIKSTNISSYNLSNVSGIPDGIAAKFVIGSFKSLLPSIYCLITFQQLHNN
jgi:hypothetical protein